MQQPLLAMIAKTGTAALQLQTNLNSGSAINFISGMINLNAKNIFLQNAALLNAESETSRITGTNGGFVEITQILNAPSSVNPGNLGAICSSTQNLGSTVIRRGHQPQTISSQSSVERYFDINPTNNAALNATLRFHYFDAELNGLNENSILLWNSADNITWNEIGVDSRNTVTNYVEKTAVADFSRWTLRSPSAPLPVIFTLINARCEDGNVFITWKTAQEINGSRFDVERSMDGSNWRVIGTVASAGNSSTKKTYLFIDKIPLSTKGLYRIAEYDLNGQIQYTSIIRSACNAKEEIFVWPNLF